MIIAWLLVLVSQLGASSSVATTVDPAQLDAIANLAQPAPMVMVPAGSFLIGTNRKDDDPYRLVTQFDDTELPQRRV